MVWMMYFLFTIAVLGFVLAYCLAVPFYILSRFYKPAVTVADFILQRGIGGLMSLQPWLRLDVQLPLSPRGKLLMANHRSHLDVFLFLAYVRGVRVVAKDTLFRIPFLGFIMRMSYQIPIVRGSVVSYFESLKTVEEYLQRQEVVLLFPEMTRSSSTLQEFTLPPFRMAQQAGTEILPIVITGTEKAWPKNSMKLHAGHTVRVRTLPVIHSAKYSSAETLSADVRQVMLRELQ